MADCHDSPDIAHHLFTKTHMDTEISEQTEARTAGRGLKLNASFPQLNTNRRACDAFASSDSNAVGECECVVALSTTLMAVFRVLPATILAKTVVSGWCRMCVSVCVCGVSSLANCYVYWKCHHLGVCVCGQTNFSSACSSGIVTKVLVAYSASDTVSAGELTVVLHVFVQCGSKEMTPPLVDVCACVLMFPVYCQIIVS